MFSDSLAFAGAAKSPGAAEAALAEAALAEASEGPQPGQEGVADGPRQWSPVTITRRVFWIDCNTFKYLQEMNLYFGE